MKTRDCSLFLFQGSIPPRAGIIDGQPVRGTSGYAGMYYCTAPKRGSLLTSSSIRPFLDYPVSPEWVFNLIQADKITYDCARRELIKSGKGLTRRLADLDRWHRCNQEEEERTKGDSCADSSARKDADFSASASRRAVAA